MGFYCVLAREAGFEPATLGSKAPRSSAELLPSGPGGNRTRPKSGYQPLHSNQLAQALKNRINQNYRPVATERLELYTGRHMKPSDTLECGIISQALFFLGRQRIQDLPNFSIHLL